MAAEHTGICGEATLDQTEQEMAAAQALLALRPLPSSVSGSHGSTVRSKSCKRTVSCSNKSRDSRKSAQLKLLKVRKEMDLKRAELEAKKELEKTVIETEKNIRFLEIEQRAIEEEIALEAEDSDVMSDDSRAHDFDDFEEQDECENHGAQLLGTTFNKNFRVMYRPTCGPTPVQPETVNQNLKSENPAPDPPVHKFDFVNHSARQGLLWPKSEPEINGTAGTSLKSVQKNCPVQRQENDVKKETLKPDGRWEARDAVPKNVSQSHEGATEFRNKPVRPQMQNSGCSNVAWENGPQENVQGSTLRVNDHSNAHNADMDSAVFIVDHLRALQNRLELPKPDIKGFSGDPLDYPRFEMAFKTNVESRTKDPVELYLNLRKYCTGKAAEAIAKFDLMDPQQAYTQATHELWVNFGQAHMVIQEFDKRLKDVSVISPGDRQAIRKHADLLEMAYISVTSLKKECALDRHVLEAAGKLPFTERRKWLHEASKIRGKREDVKFKHLVQFVKNLARELNDSEFAVLLDKKPGYDAKNNGNRAQFKPKPKSFFVSKDSSSSSAADDASNLSKEKDSKNSSDAVKSQGPPSSKEEKLQKRNCMTCDGVKPHLLANCFKLKKLPWKLRLETVKKHGLCYNCLNVDGSTAVHTTASKCPLPKECKIKECKATRKHHTLLHFDQTPKDKSAEAVNLCTDRMNDTVFFPAFPVTVKSPVTGKSVDTWAGIDTYCSSCFCDENLLNALLLEHDRQPVSVKTMHGKCQGNSTVIQLQITCRDGTEAVDIPEVYSWPTLPVGNKHIPTEEVWRKYDHLKDLNISTAPVSKITVLIGTTVSEAHRQTDWRSGSNPQDPVAVKYKWGWTLLGGGGSLECHFIDVEHNLSEQLLSLAETEYAGTKYSFDRPTSADDVKAKKTLDEETFLCEGHYYVPIPVKDSCINLVNNRPLAVNRLMSEKRKLQKGVLVVDQKTEYDVYCEIFEKYRKRGQVRRIPEDELDTDEVVNYVPFHHVYHPAKPGRLRLVWDAAARYNNSCLNDHVYSGEDSMNSLLGVLLRFRMGGETAFQADVNSMYNSIFVQRQFWNLQRFLWFKDDNLDGEIEEYQLTHNFFGGKHAPASATYALRRTCEDNAKEFHPSTVETGIRHTYVDDVIRSADLETAKTVVTEIFDLFDKGGFELAKFVSNDPRLFELVEPSRRAAKSLEEYEFETGESPQERVLGVSWDIKEDAFFFKSRRKERPITRRGLLGHVASLFDPEGSISPVTLPPKQILQKLTRQGLGWDEPFPDEDAKTVKKWLESIPQLSSLKRQRYIVPEGFGKIVHSELHAMSDGSESGYGFVIFGRYVNEEGKVHVGFLMAKALVTPAKIKTIPRIELQALVLSMRAIKFVTKEGTIKWNKIYQWVDSTAVLAMVKNHEKRFLPYCANRLQEVRDIQLELGIQLKHVPGPLNVADICSRGVDVGKFLQSHSQFYSGPEFLWGPEDKWPEGEEADLSDDFPELKRGITVVAVEKEDQELLMRIIERNSSWTKLKISIAWLLRFKAWLIQTKCGKHKELYVGRTGDLVVSEILKAETAIVTYVQRKVFCEEIGRIGKVGPKMKHTQFHKLKPFLDQAGSLRVGGRLTNSELSYNAKHQLILPRNHHLTWIMARSYHEAYLHAPPKTLLYFIRKRYWIIYGSSVTYRIQQKCIPCIRALALPRDQIQGSLPSSRVEIGHVWKQTGCDIMGAVLVKVGRSQVKRYIIGLVSFTIKAVHFEIIFDLTVPSFLNALRRFIARRSRPEKMTTDCAGTFSAGIEELNNLQNLYNNSGVENFMREQEIEWDPNVPKASHRNGLFERPFRALRRALFTTLKGQSLSDDQLNTVVVEAEHLYNSRPICALSSSPDDPQPLTPNDILNPEPAQAFAPGVFVERDLLVRNKFRQVQAMINSFWNRYKIEYLTSLQERTKSISQARNFREGDLVMLCDEMRLSHRGHYPLGVVVKVNKSADDGQVRTVGIRTQNGTFDRPVNKICLLEAAEEQ